jgi:hypothetical protein
LKEFRLSLKPKRNSLRPQKGKDCPSAEIALAKERPSQLFQSLIDLARSYFPAYPSFSSKEKFFLKKNR